MKGSLNPAGASPGLDCIDNSEAPHIAGGPEKEVVEYHKEQLEKDIDCINRADRGDRRCRAQKPTLINLLKSRNGAID